MKGKLRIKWKRLRNVEEMEEYIDIIRVKIK